MPPCVLITRPAPYGVQFAQELRRHPGGDLPMVLSPALVIEGTGTLPDLEGYRWLIFTSRSAVREFSARSDRRDVPVYAVGDATAEEARRAGMTAISCGGDARDMVARIKADEGDGPMLHLRGAHAAADIAGLLSDAGISVDEAVIYAQHLAPLTAEAQSCLTGTAPVIAPVFSPRSAAALFAGGAPKAPLVVLAISAAAAARVPEGAAQAVIVADRPDTAGMLRAWPEAVAAAYRLEGTKSAQ
ncbi:uroporphyrinogen-III synthase [Roseovarius sp. S4756]|uniref:uroporphyrinogen-III synthase n=1 Tax=Roseovarius maritimus TaxID=3342637 RepID=UPI00372A5452